ncbi:alpha/beta fold hydrolase [Saccharothrix texasensis]|uniref:alpha/beta fold hydrolase n=1 Tax=Saccharothrix texasensis TaxID=103734 RepID=UPI001FE68070|nr:alpha/beta fold hydrolase [Saccharothrix texasensis]
MDALGHLRDFQVVVPSVPGFGFSGTPTGPFDVARAGRVFAGLMARLGYGRYGVQGGDLGAYIAPEVAKAAPEHVVGVFVNGGLGFPTEADLPELTDEERESYWQMRQWSGAGVDHHALLRAAPQTFAVGWHDSPVALPAWLMHEFHESTITVGSPEQAVDRDLLLVDATLYWLTGTAGSSSWFMYDNERFAWPQGQRLVPTGVYSGPPAIRRPAGRHNDIVHWPQAKPGGHFVALEVPGLFADELRAFFGEVR